MRLFGSMLLALPMIALNANAAGEKTGNAFKATKTVVRDAKGNTLSMSSASAPYTLIGSGLWFQTITSCPVYFAPYFVANSDQGQSYYTQGFNAFACYNPSDIFAGYSVFYPNHLRGYISYGGNFGYGNFYAQNAPTATASGPNSGTSGQALSFVGGGTVDAEYSKNKALTYLWEFGNGASASGQNVSYAYPNAGNYTVTLKTFDGTFYSAPASFGVAVAGANTGLGIPQLSAFFDFEICQKEISWTAAQGATSYRLERLISSTWGEIANTTEQYFTDRGTGSRSYRVKACNGAVCGDYSNVVTAGAARCGGGGIPR